LYCWVVAKRVATGTGDDDRDGESAGEAIRESTAGPPTAGSHRTRPLRISPYTAIDIGDSINAVIAAAGYNFSPLLRWLERLLRILSPILWRFLSDLAAPKLAAKNFFTVDSIRAPAFSQHAGHKNIWRYLSGRIRPG